MHGSTRVLGMCLGSVDFVDLESDWYTRSCLVHGKKFLVADLVVCSRSEGVVTNVELERQIPTNR